jgi:hypothetical protein
MVVQSQLANSGARSRWTIQFDPLSILVRGLVPQTSLLIEIARTKPGDDEGEWTISARHLPLALIRPTW